MLRSSWKNLPSAALFWHGKQNCETTFHNTKVVKETTVLVGGGLKPILRETVKMDIFPKVWFLDNEQNVLPTLVEIYCLYTLETTNMDMDVFLFHVTVMNVGHKHQWHSIAPMLTLLMVCQSSW